MPKKNVRLIVSRKSVWDPSGMHSLPIESLKDAKYALSNAHLSPNAKAVEAEIYKRYPELDPKKPIIKHVVHRPIEKVVVKSVKKRKKKKKVLKKHGKPKKG